MSYGLEISRKCLKNVQKKMSIFVRFTYFNTIIVFLEFIKKNKKYLWCYFLFFRESILIFLFWTFINVHF